MKLGIPIPLEEWRDIKGYEGLYQISSYGRVQSSKRKGNLGGTIKTSLSNGGYPQAHLCKNSVRKTFLVHRLVALAFLDNPNNYPEVNHKDERKTNNCVWNLEYCTRKYNENYGTKRFRAAAHHDYKASAIKSAAHHDYKGVGRKLAKPIIQFDKQGNIVKLWESGQEIKRQLGYSCGNISAACRGKHKSVYGYIWKFAEDTI